MRYVFADCVLDTALATLHRAGRAIPLRPKVFHLLQYLLEQREHLVGKEAVCAQMWPGQFISDATLEGCLKLARQAIGDSGRAQRLIQTRRGYGYRFVGAVEVQPAVHAVGGRAVPGGALALPAVSSLEHTPVRSAAALTLGEPGASLGEAGAVAPRRPVAEAADGERKLVTLLSCMLAAEVAPDDELVVDTLHSQMRALYALARSEVHQYGGTLQHVAGQHLMALFGVPVAQEDHARRAVLAALGLLHRVAAQRATLGASPGAALAVRLGVHTGLVAVGGIGDEPEVTATVVGDTATLAAALQEHAAPGTILCSNTTARLIQTAVDVEALGPVLVGGQSVPVMAYKVLGKQLQSASVTPHKARPWSRFVGRSRELATVGALLARVEDGQGHVVGIMGDAGIGKSRLLDEFRQRLTGRRLTYLRGRCLSYGGATPYLPVLDLLRHHCSMTEVDSPEVITAKVSRGLQEVGMAPEEWAPYLVHLLGLEPGVEHLARLNPQTVKVRTFEALVQLSIYSSRQRPLILEVEDLHWIDATSEEWLATLVERIAGVPILMLVSYRPGYRTRWMDKSYATQLTLRQLTRGDSQQVLQTVLHTEQVSAALTQAILAKADGNPFFLEELARTVVEQGVWRLSLAVPDTIHAVLAARIDRLPAAQKNLLQAAAVIGQDVTLPLLQALVGLSEEDMQRGLRALQAAEFIYETRLVPVPTYTFKHVLTQEVAYQSLLHSTRTQYHRQIAQVVEEQLPDLAAAQPELVAHHYTEAGLNVQAVGYWQRAGEHSNARSAYMEAVAHCTTGLALLQTLPDTPARTRHELEIQLTLSRALQVTRGSVAPERGHTLARAQELCRQVGDTPQLLRVLGGLAEFYLVQGNLRTARELAEQRLTLTEGQPEPAFRMRAHVDMGATLFYLGELVLAQAHLAQAIALAVPQQNGSLVVLADEDAMVRCLGYAARMLWKLGYPDQALTRSHEMLTYAQASSHTFTLLRARYYAALIHMGRREGAAAQQQADAALTLMTEQGFGFNFDYATFARGWALAAQGQREEGIVQMRQGLATNRAMRVLLGETWSLVPLAEAYGAGGQSEDGLRLLAEALAYVDHTGERFYESEVYRLKGKLLLLQTVPDELQAEACFHQALAVARRQQAKLWELRTAMSLSRLWQEQGKHTEACRLLAPVYDWFTEGFDTVDLQEAKALLEELGG